MGIWIGNSIHTSNNASTSSSSLATTSTATTRSSITSRYKRSSNHHHHHNRSATKGTCWRNPFVVFIISFFILGSLRFRVPTRSKRIASNLLLHQRNKYNNNHSYKRDITTTSNKNSNHDYQMIKNKNHDKESRTSSINDSTTFMSYVLIEEVIGDANNNLSYQKYRAVRRDGDEDIYVTVAEWARTMMYANETDTCIQQLNNIIALSPYDALFFETPSTTINKYETQIFEFVIVNAPKLHQMTIDAISTVSQYTVHSNPFYKPIATSTNTTPYVASFANLGNDATLIVPQYIDNDPNHIATTANRDQSRDTLAKHITSNTDTHKEYNPLTLRYAHLSNFIRYGSISQITAVWNMVGQIYINSIMTRTASKTADVSSSAITNQQQQHDHPIWLSTSGMGVLYLHFRIDTTPKYYSYVPYKQG